VAGRSGSGKTTLMELICGPGHASGGTIRWQGQPLNAASPLALRSGFSVPERHFPGR